MSITVFASVHSVLLCRNAALFGLPRLYAFIDRCKFSDICFLVRNFVAVEE